MVEPDMSIYVGNKFAFKVVEMTQQVFLIYYYRMIPET